MKIELYKEHNSDAEFIAINGIFIYTFHDNYWDKLSTKQPVTFARKSIYHYKNLTEEELFLLFL